MKSIRSTLTIYTHNTLNWSCHVCLRCTRHCIYTTSMLPFIELPFITLCKYCVFYNLKVCGIPALSKSISTIFPILFARFVSLSHMLVILTVFHSFPSLLLYLLWWSVISGLWCYYYNLLNAQMMVSILIMYF